MLSGSWALKRLTIEILQQKILFLFFFGAREKIFDFTQIFLATSSAFLLLVISVGLPVLLALGSVGI